jgi:hypothetical protein
LERSGGVEDGGGGGGGDGGDGGGGGLVKKTFVWVPRGGGVEGLRVDVAAVKGEFGEENDEDENDDDNEEGEEEGEEEEEEEVGRRCDEVRGEGGSEGRGFLVVDREVVVVVDHPVKLECEDSKDAVYSGNTRDPDDCVDKDDAHEREEEEEDGDGFRKVIQEGGVVAGGGGGGRGEGTLISKGGPGRSRLKKVGRGTKEKWHVICYYDLEDVVSGRLKTPTQLGVGVRVRGGGGGFGEQTKTKKKKKVKEDGMIVHADDEEGVEGDDGACRTESKMEVDADVLFERRGISTKDVEVVDGVVNREVRSVGERGGDYEFAGD